MIFILFTLSLTGTIKGKVTDLNNNPLVGVDVMVENATIGTATDEDGNFTISRVPVGTHTLIVSMIGYETVKIPYVVVTTTKPAYIEVKLREKALSLKAVKIRASYFPAKEEAISVTEMTQEEIKRTTGVTGDVSRMIQTMPGASAPSDDRNDIVVRGGTPNENKYLIDGIPVPSLSHFQALGSGGGTIGLVQTNFIKRMRFYGGCFGPEYTNALSSAIDIKYKEGEKEKRLYAFDLSMAGAGINLDGHIGKTCYLFSARRSYLDIIKLIGTFDFEGIPQYYDIQSKITYPLTKRDRLSLLAIEGKSWINLAGWGGEEDMDIFTGFNERVMGLSYNRITEKYLMEITLSYSRPYYITDVESHNFSYENNSFEEYFPLNINLTIPFRIVNIKTGIFASYIQWKHWILYSDTTETDTLINKEDNTISGSYYLKFSKKIERFFITTGASISYFDYTENFSISPMISLSYELTDRLSLNGGYGIYHQHPLLIWLTANEENKNLKDMKATHYLAGMDYLLREDTKINVETYYKKYRNYPADTEDSTRILLNEGGSYEGYLNFHPLNSEGKGETYGVDISLQKRFSNHFYGTLVYSFADAELIPLNGEKIKSVFVYPHSFKVILGIELPWGFEFGMRFNWAKGKYYYPIDSLASANAGVVIRDYSTLKQYPDYHRLDFKISKREFFKKFTIEWYNEIENVYNRKNIREYYWNNEKKSIEPAYQWGFLFVGGFRIEF